MLKDISSFLFVCDVCLCLYSCTYVAETNLQLDIMRNRIMRYNVYLAMMTFSVALVAIVPGLSTNPRHLLRLVAYLLVCLIFSPPLLLVYRDIWNELVVPKLLVRNDYPVLYLCLNNYYCYPICVSAFGHIWSL